MKAQSGPPDAQPAPAQAPKGRKLKLVLRTGFVVAITVAALVWFVDLGEMGRLLAAASPVLVAACTATAILDLIVVGAKWNLVLRAFDVHVPWTTAIAAYFRGQVFALFIPSILGTDAYRVYHLRRRGAPVVPTVSAVIVERVLGALSSLTAVCFLLPFALRGLDVAHQQLWSLGALALGALLVAALWFCFPFASGLERMRLVRLLPGKVQKIAREFLHVLGRSRGQRPRLMRYFAISNAEKVLYGTCVFWAARAVGLQQVEFAYCIAAVPLIALLERLPISVAALGVREGLFVALLHPYSVDVNEAIAVALVVRFADLLRTGIGVLFWLLSAKPDPNEALGGPAGEDGGPSL